MMQGHFGPHFYTGTSQKSIIINQHLTTIKRHFREMHTDHEKGNITNCDYNCMSAYVGKFSKKAETDFQNQRAN